VGKILSIESATDVGSVALHSNGELITVIRTHLEKSHSRLLAKSIAQILQLSQVDKDELAAIAISSGPGSYTGLRIGVSSAKGLSFALGIPLIAVDTLKIMAAQVAHFKPGEALLCPMIDARRMEVYSALYDEELNTVRKVEAEILDESSYSSLLDKHKIIFFGNGAVKLQRLINHPNAQFLHGIIPDAAFMGRLAFSEFSNEQFEDTDQFEPNYLKPFHTTKPKNAKVA